MPLKRKFPVCFLDSLLVVFLSDAKDLIVVFLPGLFGLLLRILELLAHTEAGRVDCVGGAKI